MKRLSLLLAALLLFAAFTSLRAEAPKPDPFAPENQDPRSKPDPFAPENMDPRSKDGVPPGPVVPKQQQVRVDWEARLEPTIVAPGRTFRLIITGKPREGFHTYPIKRRSSNPEQRPGQLSRVIIQASPGLQAIWPLEESAPQWYLDKQLGMFLVYDNEF